MVKKKSQDMRKKGVKYQFKNMFSKQNRAAMVCGVMVFTVIASLVGILGLLIACNVLVAMPFIAAMVNGNADVEFTTVDEEGNSKKRRGAVQTNKGGSIVDNTKQMWSEASTQKKAAIAGGVGIMLPLILVVVMWAAVMAVAFAVDLLIVVPVALVVGFFIFRNPEKQTNQITKALGHPLVGVGSIIAVVVILGFAATQYVELTAMEGGSKNVVEYMEPISTNPEDYEVTSVFDPINGTWDNTTTPIIAETVLFHVVDDFYYGAGFDTYLTQEFNETENRVDVTDSDMAIPVANAIISLNGIRKDTAEYIHLGGLTDGSGDFLFSNIPYGNYEITVDAAGYQKFVKYDVHIQEAFENNTVNVHLSPVYYKVGLEYCYYETEDYESSHIGSANWWKEKEISTENGSITVSPFLAGALEKNDLDRFKRQQSMWGWTGLPQEASLNNQILHASNQMAVTTQSIMNQMSNTIRLMQGFTHINELTTEWNYGGHSVHTTQALVYDAEGFGYDVYINQFPSPNSYVITNNTEQSYEQYGITYANETQASSGLTHCVWEYLVWSTVPEAQDMRIQFEVKTYITIVNTTVQDGFWSARKTTTTEDTIVVTEIVDFTYRINLPTVETLVVG